MSAERDYFTFAVDGLVAVIGTFVVAYATVKIAGVFGITISLGTPTVATIAFTIGMLVGGVLGLIGALRWPDHAVAIHDAMVPERETDE